MPDPAGPVRLQRHLARCGLGSRRACEEWIRAGRVTVNGRPALLGSQVDPAADEVCVDGCRVHARHLRVLVLNKPAGVTTTRRDPHARRCITDLLAPEDRDLFPVGRLDRDTEGLLLITNDGDLAHALAHPSRRVERVYLAAVEGRPSPHALARLHSGVTESGERLTADRAWIADPDGDDAARPLAADGDAIVEVTLHRGRKREVRRMLAVVGHPVVRLVRIRFGPVALGDLAPGRMRAPTARESAELARIRRRPTHG